LPELPLERTLSRKSVLYQVGRLIGGNETRLDLSTPDSGALVDKSAPDDQMPLIIWQQASIGVRFGLAGDIAALSSMSRFRSIGAGALIRTGHIAVESEYG
jgi:hypothetical protein